MAFVHFSGLLEPAAQRAFANTSKTLPAGRHGTITCPDSLSGKRLSRKLSQSSLSHRLKPSHVSDNTGQPPALNPGYSRVDFK